METVVETTQSAQVEKPEAKDYLAVVKWTLEQIGQPAHHTVINDFAKAHGLCPDNPDALCTKVWNDTRKNAEKTEFAFYGKSVYGLKEWGLTNEEGVQFAPARKAKAPETKEERIARLKKELAELEA